MTDTIHTDSVETTIEEVAQTIKIIACKAGYHGRTWKEADKMIRYELSKLVQAHTSQQVEELTAEITDLKATCFTMDDVQQQVEEAVKREQQRIIDFLDNEENQTKSRLDWPYGWALDAVEKFITSNHQD